MQLIKLLRLLNKKVVKNRFKKSDLITRNTLLFYIVSSFFDGCFDFFFIKIITFDSGFSIR